MPNPALIEAAQNGSIETLSALLSQGAFVDECNEAGSTALIESSLKGHVDAIKLLIKYGANVNITNKNGNTALHMACVQNHPQVVHELLQSGALVNIHNKVGGRTPLLTAIALGRLIIVEILLKAGSSLQEKTYSGETALLVAAGAGQLHVFEWLLQKGSSLDEKNNAGETAFEIATKIARRNIVEFIEEHNKKSEKISPSPSLVKKEHLAPIQEPQTSTHKANRRQRNKLRKQAESIIPTRTEEKVVNSQTEVRPKEEYFAVTNKSSSTILSEKVIETATTTEKGEATEYLFTHHDFTEHLKVELKIIEGKFSDQKQYIEKLEKQNRQLSQELEQLKNKVKSISQLEGSLQEQSLKIHSLEETLQKKTEELSITKEQVVQLQQHIKKLQSQIDQNSQWKKQSEYQERHIKQLETSIAKQNTEQTKALQQATHTIEQQANLLKAYALQLSKLEKGHEEQRTYTKGLESVIQKQESQIHVMAQMLHEVEGKYTQLIANQMSIKPVLHHSISLPDYMVRFLNLFVQAGYEALIVGGAVRDYLMERNPTDVDIITSAPPQNLLTLFKDHLIKESPFVKGLYQITYNGLKIDIICCDKEIFYSEKAFLQDAEKRVFTVNALYCDSKGQIYDPLDIGLKDLLEYPLLRLIGDEAAWFQKEPLLLLRAIRLATEYSLAIFSPTQQRIQQYAPHLKQIEAAQLHNVLKRHFLSGYAVKNFECLINFGLFAVLFPESAEFFGSATGTAYQQWLWNKLYHTDQLVISHSIVSMNYIYALFVVGIVLSTFNQSSIKNSLSINYLIDQAINKTFFTSFDFEHITRIKGMVHNCMSEWFPSTQNSQATADSSQKSEMPQTRFFKRQ